MCCLKKEDIFLAVCRPLVRLEWNPKLRGSSVEFLPQSPELVPVRDGRVRGDGGVQSGAELHVVEHLQKWNILPKLLRLLKALSRAPKRAKVGAAVNYSEKVHSLALYIM